MRKPPNPAAFRWMAVCLAPALLAIIAGGGWFYDFQHKQQLSRVEANLTAIARLKADQITRWRAERTGDAAMLMDRRSLVRDIADYFTAPAEAIVGEIKRRFTDLQASYHYANILLVDPDGRVQVSLNGHDVIDHNGFVGALATALFDRRPVFTELHTEKDGSSPHISVVAPLYANDQPLGAIILISNARAFLFPLIQSWPVPSRSAETLLVRRDGDHVLFLNDLRHQPNSGLKLRIPLSRADLPAVMAVTGYTGVTRAKDYRNADVVAVTLPVPGSPWFIVSKMDEAEAFAEWHFRSALILALILVGSGIITVLGAAFWLRERKKQYQLLFQSETDRRMEAERYRTTLRSIGDAVIVTDAAGRVTLLNPVAESLTGWKEPEAKGQRVEDVFRIANEETGAIVESPVARVLREGRVVGLANHTILIARDGARRPIADSGAPVRDDAGDIISVVLVFRDQTEEQAAQKALRDSEQKYRRLYESMTDAFVAVDLAGRVQEYNPAFQSMVGYTDRELHELTYQDLTPEKWHSLETAVVEDQILKRGYSDVYEKEYRRVDGTVFPVELRTFLIRDEAASPIGMWAIVRDITGRKQAEAALLEKTGLLQSITDNIFDMVSIADVQGQLRFINAAHRQTLGYEPDALIGTDVMSLVHPDDRDLVATAMTDGFLSQSRHRMVEYRCKRADGGYVWVETVGDVLRDLDGNPKDLLFSSRDISVRKQAEAEKERLSAQLMQAQKMESVGRLAGGVAHDFNNMLNVILGHAELALDQVGPDDPLREDLTEIFDAARRSAEITKQLLAFARRQIIVPRTVYLNDTVEKMLKMLRRLIGEDIDLAWKPGSGLWPVYADAAQIDQILANLCLNARDAIDGTGRITIETQNTALDEAYCAGHAEFVSGEYVVLSVSDDGRGMDKVTMDNLFEPFFTTKNVNEGTGLGLATVYGIVRQNNGFINVYSEPGHGATFRIYLPRHAGTPDETEARDTTVLPAGNGETVLVVEDEAAVLKLTQKTLTGLGYTVLKALSPQAALKLVDSHSNPIDLLITDVVMPGMNGRALSEKLKARYPTLRVLFMSGYTANVIAHRGILDEGVHFIQKPFNRVDLARKVREALLE
ncbi:PAS domain S-box protein [Desulfosudis oleivorans]|uniref:histidine kinase n=1 Tax=Desulfosudis oleivorans (strain DSM 6200 / JCM 39069 / Hxd3) TaxID=96561 RepID=A9A0Q1_DESOH|nr:PAS domain S-box protein [Desulfosudis oleivorans]ABW69068.1 PAS/PAC sensor hybrid histidine kinase [Desulfosudis oleivorans Hxd3]